MSKNRNVKKSARREPLITELLLMPDGRILVHNLTSTFAELLNRLDPEDQQIISRILRRPPSS
ncbi:MAG TPA: hypothetical protein VH597_02830 [Verrucomicrobiae bacterium]|nr:hypothetical protein [Verrucomicrobiae bacterium]